MATITFFEDLEIWKKSEVGRMIKYSRIIGCQAGNLARLQYKKNHELAETKNPHLEGREALKQYKQNNH